ncbi:DUF4369 domain-containing protein [Winogradskyella undariae]|uniref:DUF4369 domain-containing protein n=1 Tax=Winogradskyella undariae TaxID=1285465 RepID=UPI00156AD8C4|nr:DUF4369 domain-containing protein [Winogradskyella undariae]NRR90458.1 DUF4369 domain-containing protein [Winogradskyella undariae]
MTKLNKVLSLIILVALAVSCGKDNDANFTLKGNIKGLKKGIVYLQKEGDSSIIDLDSMVISGQTEFSLHTNIDEPVILYLKLHKNDKDEHYIPFFADKGTTEISTTLKTFNYDYEIKGSKQQELLEAYVKVMSSYNHKNLDLIEASFIAQKDNDSITLDSLNNIADKLIKRKYAYTIQYAINNKDSEIAPYLALYETQNANPVYIDSIYNNLNEEIKNSFYGKKLKEVIANRN